MKINVRIDRISIKVEGGEEQWYTLEVARELQAQLDAILGPVDRVILLTPPTPTSPDPNIWHDPAPVFWQPTWTGDAIPLTPKNFCGGHHTTE